jgi:hypothetical protein
MFHIFISSCFEGLNIQIPRLINNIIECNIPCEYVHFIIGGCPDEKEYYINNIHIIHVKYRCFEFTPHIFIVKNPNYFNFDYAFFTHDTVKIGSTFYNTITNDILYLKNTNYDTMKIENLTPSMNIGIYSKNIILKNKDILLSLCLNSNNNDELFKLKNYLIDYEDFIFKQNNFHINDTAENTKINLISINNRHIKGLSKYYKRIDFIKYQTNIDGFIQSIDIYNL